MPFFDVLIRKSFKDAPAVGCYQVYGYLAPSADDAVQQAKIDAERKTDDSQLFMFSAGKAGAAGSFDHLVGTEFGP